MLFSPDNAVLDILSADRMCWAGGSFVIRPRTYSALAFRIRGRATITVGEKIYTAQENSVLYMPQGVPYSAQYSDTEILVIHFVTLHNDPAPVIASLERPEAAYRLFLQAAAIWERKSPTGRLELMALVYNLLKAVIEDGAQPHRLPPAFTDAVAYIHAHYTDGSLSVPEICENGHLSQTTFRTLFQQHYGKTPVEYIRELRIEHARNRLLCGATVEQAALESGFNDPKYFARIIRQRFGCTPRELKNYGK